MKVSSSLFEGGIYFPAVYKHQPYFTYASEIDGYDYFLKPYYEMRLYFQYSHTDSKLYINLVDIEDDIIIFASDGYITDCPLGEVSSLYPLDKYKFARSYLSSKKLDIVDYIDMFLGLDKPTVPYFKMSLNAGLEDSFAEIINNNKSFDEYVEFAFSLSSDNKLIIEGIYSEPSLLNKLCKTLLSNITISIVSETEMGASYDFSLLHDILLNYESDSKANSLKKKLESSNYI